MAAILAAIVPLIIALLPYIEKLIQAILDQRNAGGAISPRQRRQLSRALHHSERCRQACERLRDTAALVSAYPQDLPEE